MPVFDIVPAPAKAIWFFGAIIAFLLLMALLFAWFAYASLHARFEVGPEGLTIRSALYGRTIPAAALRTEGAEVVSLAKRPDLQLRLRTNGIGLPGYGAGWFRLRGGAKALAFITDSQRVVHVPTTDGYDLLLSVQDPDGFVQALQR